MLDSLAVVQTDPPAVAEQEVDCSDVDIFTKLGNGIEGAAYGFAIGASVWLLYYLYTELSK